VFLIYLKKETVISELFYDWAVKKIKDPVADPREPVSKIINRLIQFEEPPLVERSDLPIELQP